FLRRVFRHRAFRGSYVLPRDDDVVEIHRVDAVFRPTIRDVRLEREAVRTKPGRLPPIDSLPVAAELAVDPEGLLAIRLSGSVVDEEELDRDPTLALDLRLRRGAEGVSPILAVGRRLHLVPVAVEVPLPRWIDATPISPRLDRRREALVALRLDSGAAES